jgi:hypothetical protein
MHKSCKLLQLCQLRQALERCSFPAAPAVLKAMKQAAVSSVGTAASALQKQMPALLRIALAGFASASVAIADRLSNVAPSAGWSHLPWCCSKAAQSPDAAAAISAPQVAAAAGLASA